MPSRVEEGKRQNVKQTAENHNEPSDSESVFGCIPPAKGCLLNPSHLPPNGVYSRIPAAQSGKSPRIRKNSIYTSETSFTKYYQSRHLTACNVLRDLPVQTSLFSFFNAGHGPLKRSRRPLMSHAPDLKT